MYVIAGWVVITLAVVCDGFKLSRFGDWDTFIPRVLLYRYEYGNQGIK